MTRIMGMVTLRDEDYRFLLGAAVHGAARVQEMMNDGPWRQIRITEICERATAQDAQEVEGESSGTTPPYRESVAALNTYIRESRDSEYDSREL